MDDQSWAASSALLGVVGDGIRDSAVAALRDFEPLGPPAELHGAVARTWVARGDLLRFLTVGVLPNLEDDEASASLTGGARSNGHYARLELGEAVVRLAPTPEAMSPIINLAAHGAEFLSGLREEDLKEESLPPADLRSGEEPRTQELRAAVRSAPRRLEETSWARELDYVRSLLPRTKAADELLASWNASLSPRERELIEFLIAAATNESIAEQVGIRPEIARRMLQGLIPSSG